MFAAGNMKKIFLFLLVAFLLVQQIIMLPGCANIVPPLGGARDSLPPRLLKATPHDSTRNFNGDKISFSFDEFIDVKNAESSLLMSPSPKTNPVTTHKLNTLTLKLRDSLESNTTYTINFGDAIQDFNEGNVLKNFSYTFSTGPYIDSLTLRGKVILAETGKVDSTLIAMLYTNSNDSAVVKEKPRYIARLDGNGEFVFKNLPPKTFYLYALKDDSHTQRYLDEKQLFAFTDVPIIVSDSVKPATLYAYSVTPESPSIASPSINISPGNRGKNTLRNAEDRRLKYQTTLINGQQDLLSSFSILLEHPLRNFDSSKIHLFTDSIFTPVSNVAFIKDSSNRKINLKVEWQENTWYHIVMNKDFAEDSLGKKLLKTDTLSFWTKKLSDYGALKLTLRNLDLNRNPVLQFVVNNVLYKSFSLTSNTFSEKLFLPGEYELRILFDNNKNGKWDPGIFFGKHVQPEIVKPVERKITVKPAWENEVEIVL